MIKKLFFCYLLLIYTACKNDTPKINQKENYLPFIVNKKDNPHIGEYIEIELIDKETKKGCFLASIMKNKPTIAHIEWIGTENLSCGLPKNEKYKAKKIIDLFVPVAKALGTNKIFINDISQFTCKNTVDVRLNIPNLLKYGQTLYERYGFKTRYMESLLTPLPDDLKLRQNDISIVQNAKAKTVLNNVKNILITIKDDNQTFKDFALELLEKDCIAFDNLIKYLNSDPKDVEEEFIMAFDRLSWHGLFMEMDLK